MTTQKTLRERFLDHAVSVGFGREAIMNSLKSKEEQEGGLRPYHHEIANGGSNNGHYVDVNKENYIIVGAVSIEKGIETVYRWEAQSKEGAV